MYDSKVQYIEKLGSGGFGVVHKALVTEIEGTVAVKELSNPGIEGIERFKREVLLLSRMNHMNIMPVLKHQLENQPYWFAMPLAKSSLVDELDYVRHDLAQLHEYFTQILRGLSHAHTQGIIHRDLKPQNILIFHDKVCISDFGLGKRINSTELYTTFTQTGSQGGTIVYASPEQMRNLKNADVRSDIYSLGKMLYHMLTGEEPFPDMEFSKVDDRYRYIVERCTRRDPDRRFQTITELIGAFSTISDKVSFSRVKKADEELAEILQKDVNADVIGRIQELFLQNRSDADFYWDYFPKLSKHHLEFFVKNRLEDFKIILEQYDEYVSDSLSFSYCDVVADLYRNILDSTEDLAICKLVFTRLLLMGVSHNRFYVTSMFCDLISAIDESEISKAFKAKEIMETHSSETNRIKEKLDDVSMLKLLREAVNNIDSD